MSMINIDHLNFDGILVALELIDFGGTRPDLLAPSELGRAIIEPWNPVAGVPTHS